MELLNDFAPVFGALVGVPALITMLINLLKQFEGMRKHDGKMKGISQWMNLVVYLGLFGVKTFKPEFDLGPVDEIAGAVAQFGYGLIGLIPLGMFISGKVHGEIRGLPVVGKTFNPET